MFNCLKSFDDFQIENSFLDTKLINIFEKSAAICEFCRSQKAISTVTQLYTPYTHLNFIYQNTKLAVHTSLVFVPYTSTNGL